jgi:hypothetical protein
LNLFSPHSGFFIFRMNLAVEAFSFVKIFIFLPFPRLADRTA